MVLVRENLAVSEDGVAGHHSSLRLVQFQMDFRVVLAVTIEPETSSST